MAADASLPGLLLWSLPAMFVLHDAEEALLLPSWLRRNREFLAQRFPRLSRRLLPRFDAVSPLKFAAMAAEELALLLAVTLYARFAGGFYPWLALFLAFGVHLFVHIAQWIAARRCVPAGTTSPVYLLYWGWGLCLLIDSRLFTLREFLLCGAAGCAAAAVNLLFLHRLAAKPAARAQDC